MWLISKDHHKREGQEEKLKFDLLYDHLMEDFILQNKQLKRC